VKTRQVETIVVGAGQAGLVMSSFLRDAGREHVVLDRRETLGGGWQDRWDAFRLVTPNWVTSLPGFPYDGPEPDGFMPRDDVVARVRRYAEVIDAPVELGTEVRRLARANDGGEGFVLETNRDTFAAAEVVVAAGPFQAPRIPPAGAGLPKRVRQVHSHHYRNEAALPPGTVLIVGTGQSGLQLTEELVAAGRQVILSVGHCGRVPRRYRGRDTFVWLVELLKTGKIPTVDKLPDPRMRFVCNPHVSGHGGGHDTNLRRLGAEGVRLVGRFEGADGERVTFAPDLEANLQFADQFFDKMMRSDVDRFIEAAGIDAPPDEPEQVAYDPPAVRELDLAAEGVSTVLWTSGYRLDFSWIDLPIFDEHGAPRHVRGVSEVPGLAFLGLPWQLSQPSSTFIGVAADAAYLAERW
jgi:putative flavoprotein involved in K+ transport